MPAQPVEPLLTPAEAAALLGVDTQTVSRWERAGRLKAVRTLGGHRRFVEREIRHLSSAMRSSLSA